MSFRPRHLLRLIGARFFPSRWMKSAWERRARENALHYVADFRGDWQGNEHAFFASGLDDVDRVLQLAGWQSTGEASLLEIGCGVGRMTRHLAARFGRVTALDVSPTMVAKARALNPGLANAEFVEGNGVDLSLFPAGSFDYVLSYIVFQHLPTEAIIEGNVRESLRVLRPGGQFLFQARDDHGRAGSDTYNGAALHRDRVEAIARAHGRRVIQVVGAGTQECYYLVGEADPE